MTDGSPANWRDIRESRLLYAFVAIRKEMSAYAIRARRAMGVYRGSGAEEDSMGAEMLESPQDPRACESVEAEDGHDTPVWLHPRVPAWDRTAGATERAQLPQADLASRPKQG